MTRTDRKMLHLAYDSRSPVGALYGRYYQCALTKQLYFCFTGQPLASIRECYKAYQTSNSFFPYRAVFNVSGQGKSDMLVPVGTELKRKLRSVRMIYDAICAHEYSNYRFRQAIPEEFIVGRTKAVRAILDYLVRYFNSPDNEIWVVNDRLKIFAERHLENSDLSEYRYAFRLSRQRLGDVLFIAVDSGEVAHFPMVGATGEIIKGGHLSEVISKWE
jgi:hypothetical protein